MTTREFTEGDWAYIPGRWTWTATNSRTGQVVGPAATVTDLRRGVYQATRSDNPQVTLISGPGRALSVRRYTRTFVA